MSLRAFPTGRSAAREFAEFAPQGECAFANPFVTATMIAAKENTTTGPAAAHPATTPKATAVMAAASRGRAIGRLCVSAAAIA